MVLIDIRDDLGETKTFLELHKQAVCLMKADLGEEGEIERVWAQIIKKHAKVDILVNNAARV